MNQVIDILSGHGAKITCLNIAPSMRSDRDDLINLCHSSFLPIRFTQLLIHSFFFFLSRNSKATRNIIWLYNTRSAEFVVAFVALILRPQYQLVLQLEDLPSARQANHGVSGVVDLITTKLLNSRADYIFSVSSTVAKAFRRIVNSDAIKITVLPPSLDCRFNEIVNNRNEPFSSKHITVLYAGSFAAEKGVLDLIDAFLQLDSIDCKLLLIGSATPNLISQYMYYENIHFTGVVDDLTLFGHYASADIVVNPHRPILNSDYVFPFKLVETVASGSLPLSTPVPGSDLLGLPDDCFFNDVHELVTMLSQSRTLWKQNSKQLKSCAAECRRKYSFQSVGDEVKRTLRLS